MNKIQCHYMETEELSSQCENKAEFCINTINNPQWDNETFSCKKHLAPMLSYSDEAHANKFYWAVSPLN